MKIAFWSNSRGKSGVTSNLACISVASAMEYTYRAVLIENHYQKNKIENALIYNFANYYCREVSEFSFRHTGMDYLIHHPACEKHELPGEKPSDRIRSDTLHASKLIKEASIEILRGSLYYIPQYQLTNHETFEYDLYGNINPILNTLETFADITYIDTSGQNNLSSKIILDEADLIVVNFVQEASAINHFFDNYSSILSKSVFLISSYRRKSNLSINKISRTHLINKSSIAVIPYNVDYEEAVSRGTIVDFLYHNYSCKRSDPNYKFIRDVRKAVFMIMSHLEENSRKDGT